LLVLTSGKTVPASSLSVRYEVSTHTATFSFPGFRGGVLPDGKYRATLRAAGVADARGQSLRGDYATEFFYLRGDADHSGTVGLADFRILLANYGKRDRDFTQGDFDHDRDVDRQDFNVLVKQFGLSVTGESQRPSGRSLSKLLKELKEVVKDRDRERERDRDRDDDDDDDRRGGNRGRGDDDRDDDDEEDDD